MAVAGTGEVDKVGPAPFNKNGSFARILSATLLLRRPEWTGEQVDKEVRHRWSLWMANQTRKPIVCQEEVREAARKCDFGFARTDGKTWFPATKKVEVVRAGRVQVVFSLTGEALFVPLENWRPYSAEVALELVKDKVANKGGFRAALKEMREAMRSEESGVPGVSGSREVGMARTLGEVSNQKLWVENRDPARG